ncbi:MAG: DUF3168 domain-containing protein [Planctomycetaceae bacterium]|nr:DUF3168 domain-containing protein [Planctomycetaceae bacterium]
MAVGEGIRTRLLAVSGVTDITSAVYVSDTPQSATEPRIEVHELNLDPMVVMEGTSGLRSATIDIDCKSTTPVKAKALADAVEAAFNDFTGAAGDITVKAVVFQDRSDSTEAPSSGSQKSVYVTTLDYLVQYT